MSVDRAAVVARLRAAGCVYAEDEAALIIDAAGSAADVERLVDRRAAGEPLEHVVGWAELGGLRVPVAAGVFVPRRRSELLVREAAALARTGSVVLDLCCGSGALGAAVAARVDGIELHASDLDPAAAACARANLAGLAAGVYQGDLYEPLPARLRGRVDVLIAHVPYVPTAEIAFLPAEARLHEPLVALDGGADGLDVARRVVQGAPTWLAAGGSVLFETSDRQQAEAVTVVRAAGLLPRVARSDELGATVVLGLSRPAADPPGQAAAP